MTVELLCRLIQRIAYGGTLQSCSFSVYILLININASVFTETNLDLAFERQREQEYLLQKNLLEQ